MAPISLQERLRGAIWGQFIGDAAAFSTHFIENSQGEILESAPADAKHIHVHQASADFTPYGDAARLLLQSLVAEKGFSARDFGTRFVEIFASPNYHHPINTTAQQTIENYYLSLEEGHPDFGYEFQGGANTTDLDTATRLASLVALYWDDPELLSFVDKATRVTQNNELTLAYMRSFARTLVHLFQGRSLKEAFRLECEATDHDTPFDQHVRKKIAQALEMESQSIIEATKALGLGSILDQSYPAAIQTALKHSSSFKEGIKETLEAGGDNAGRAALVGTLLGSSLGIGAIPQEWKQRLLTHHPDIEPCIETLLHLKAST